MNTGPSAHFKYTILLCHHAPRLRTATYGLMLMRCYTQSASSLAQGTALMQGLHSLNNLAHATCMMPWAAAQGGSCMGGRVSETRNSPNGSHTLAAHVFTPWRKCSLAVSCRAPRAAAPRP